MKIHQFIICAFILFFQGKIQAQQSYYLSVITDESNEENVSSSNLSRIETKILSILTKNNIGAKGKEHPIIIYPKVEVQDIILHEGIENAYFINTDITYVVKNIHSDIVYATHRESVRGIGTSEEKAMAKAIDHLDTHSKHLDIFLETTAQKVMNYFEEYCPEIIASAQMLSEKQEFDEAFDELERIPIKSSCYKEALKASQDIFLKSQEPICGSLLRQAKTFVVQDRYNEAMKIIATIKYGTPCDDLIEQLLNDVQTEINNRERRQENIQLQMKEYELQLEQLRQRGVSHVPPSIPRMKDEYRSPPPINDF